MLDNILYYASGFAFPRNPDTISNYCMKRDMSTTKSMIIKP